MVDFDEVLMDCGVTDSTLSLAEKKALDEQGYLMSQPQNDHPDQVIITAGTGSVLVFNGHVYHSGTRNDSNAPRRVITCQFVARRSAPPGSQRTYSSEGLTPAARCLLGV